MHRPLQGCRIIDFGIITAGAATSALLADLGAEVIKVESPTYRDPFRAWTGQEISPAGGAGSPPFFRSNNRGKRGISIDLKQPQGQALVLRLIARSHMVLDNFRRGVLDRLGLTEARMRAANPDIILLSISSQGSSGPDAQQVSFGSTLEAVGGLAWLTGYPGDGPVISGRELNYPDQVVALFAAGAALAAWLGRARGPATLDVSQRELTSFLLGEMFLAPDAAEARRGNASPDHALQGCYRSTDGRWVAVTVEPDGVPALHTCIGATPDALEPALQAWIQGGTAEDRVAHLTAAGIAAAIVLDARTLATATPPPWQHAFATTPDGALIKAMPFALDSAPFTMQRDAPAVGGDSAAILREIAGLTDAEIAALLDSGVVEDAARRAPEGANAT